MSQQPSNQKALAVLPALTGSKLMLSQISQLPEAKRVEEAGQLMRTVTLSNALVAGVQIKAALADERLMMPVKNQIAALVNNVCLSFGPSGIMTDEAKRELCRSISEQYGHLNIEEIALAFRNGQAGNYGQQYHKLNAASFLNWLNLYANSEERLGFWESENNSRTEYVEEYADEFDKKGKKTGKRILVNRYRAGKPVDDTAEINASAIMQALKPRMMSNGRIAFGGPAPEPAASELPEMPKPGSAAWHRMEADRMEAREARQQKDFEARRQVGQFLIEEEAQKKAFQEYADEHFYSILNKEEREVMEASTQRFLSPTEMRVNERINLSWQGVVLGWEQLLHANIVAAGEAANQ